MMTCWVTVESSQVHVQVQDNNDWEVASMIYHSCRQPQRLIETTSGQVLHPHTYRRSRTAGYQHNTHICNADIHRQPGSRISSDYLVAVDSISTYRGQNCYSSYFVYLAPHGLQPPAPRPIHLLQSVLHTSTPSALPPISLPGRLVAHTVLLWGRRRRGLGCVSHPGVTNRNDAWSEDANRGGRFNLQAGGSKIVFSCHSLPHVSTHRRVVTSECECVGEGLVCCLGLVRFAPSPPLCAIG
ncbi:hypothetical protein V8C44DRAFT_339176 [Trichoderma aethiopicum]